MQVSITVFYINKSFFTTKYFPLALLLSFYPFRTPKGHTIIANDRAASSDDQLKLHIRLKDKRESQCECQI